MTEEAVRLLARQSRLSENSGISNPLAALLAASSFYMPRWQWLIGPGDRCDMDLIMVSTRQHPGLAPSANLCSLLLRLISLALTAAKATVCLPRGNELLAPSGNSQAYCFHLWQCAKAAVHVAFEFPTGMKAARGMTALLLQPALVSLVEASPGREHTSAPASALLSSFHAEILSCCSDLPARLNTELLVSSSAWSVVEQEADCLMQDSAVRASAADIDALAASLSEYLFSVMTSLACSAFSLPHFNCRAGLSKMIYALLAGYAARLPARGFPATFVPCYSSVFLDAAAECRSSSSAASGTSMAYAVTRSQPSDALVILHRVLSSPVWDRVWEYRFSTKDKSSNAFDFHMGSLIAVGAILEEQQLKGWSLEHVIASNASDAGGSSGLGSAANVGPQSKPMWREAWLLLTNLCHLRMNKNFGGAREDLSESITEALGKLREALSGIIGCDCAPGGASSVVGAAGAGSAVADVAAADMGAVTGVVAAGAAAAGRQGGGLGVRDWELVQAELLLGLPEEMWGVRPCCNTACRKLEGPCEMEVKTRACGGGCGARYCCAACQEQAWRGGHRRNCAAMREMKDRRGEEEG